jgi:hypothetical protein
LSDRSFDDDPQKVTRLARLLCDQAASDQQVLVVTTRTAVSEQFRQLDVPTLIVTRQPPATTAGTRSGRGIPPAEVPGVL